MSNLKEVELIFENCEVLTIPGKYVTDLEIGNITKRGHGANLWMKVARGKCNDGWYYETCSAESVGIGIDKEFMNGHNCTLGGDKPFMEYTNLERVKKWADITHIKITNKERGYLWVLNPFTSLWQLIVNLATFWFFSFSGKREKYTLKDKFGLQFRLRPIRKKFCIKWNKKDSKYAYSVPWYFEEETFEDENGVKHSSEDINKYQKTTEEEDCILITLSKEN